MFGLFPKKRGEFWRIKHENKIVHFRFERRYYLIRILDGFGTGGNADQ